MFNVIQFYRGPDTNDSNNNGAYAQAAATALSAGITAGVSKKQQKRQNETNLANYNMVNAYNTPTAQMQRYKDAGLNPNLMYGSGVSASSAGNAGSAPEAVAPRSVAGSIAEAGPDAIARGFSMLQQLKDLEMKSAQIENVKFDTQLKSSTMYSQSIKQAVDELYNFGQQHSFMKDDKYLGDETPLMMRFKQNYQTNENKQALQKQDLNIKRLLATGQQSKNKLLEYQSDPYMYFGTSILKSMAPYLSKMPSLNSVTRARRK